jgi:isopenicillin-N epimerase
MSRDWAALRHEMLLDPAVTQLNSGSFGPTPRPIYEAAERFRREFVAGPTHFVNRLLPGYLGTARQRLGQFLNVPVTNLVFQTNVSTAINQVAAGLTLNQPGEILLTDHEYGAMHWCWERAAQRLGLRLRTFSLPTMTSDPEAIVAAARNAMTDKTRLFFFSHVLSPTGLVLPARELCALARKKGILTVIDGAHAPGMLPLDVSAVGADFYAANCHKWMLAPNGCGFLAIGPGQENRLNPLQVSWGYRADPGVKPDDMDAYGSTPRTRFLEFEGSKDFSPWLAVPAAIDYTSAIGWDAIRKRMAELTAFARETMAPLKLKLATPADPLLHGSMVAWELPKSINATTLRSYLWARKIEIPVIERPDRTLIRVSCHYYTQESEIETWVTAMNDWLLDPTRKSVG